MGRKKVSNGYLLAIPARIYKACNDLPVAPPPGCPLICGLTANSILFNRLFAPEPAAAATAHVAAACFSQLACQWRSSAIFRQRPPQSFLPKGQPPPPLPDLAGLRDSMSRSCSTRSRSSPFSLLGMRTRTCTCAKHAKQGER